MKKRLTIKKRDLRNSCSTSPKFSASSQGMFRAGAMQRVSMIPRKCASFLGRAAYFLGLGAAVASVSFVLQSELLNTQPGAGSPAPQSSLVLLLADTQHNGFAALQGGSSITLGSLLGGDDKIVFKTNMSAFATNGVLSTTTPGLNLDSFIADMVLGSWSPGDPLAIVWFPDLTLASGVLSAGESYGRLTLGTAAGSNGSQAASDPFVTPSDGTGDYKLIYLSDEAGANNLYGASGPGAATAANLTVVPEPTSLSLILAAGVLLCLAHRRSSPRVGSRC